MVIMMNSNKMRAVAYTNYGSPDVLELKEVQKPTPKDSEVLIKVLAAATNVADWRLMRASPFLVRLMGGGILNQNTKYLELMLLGQLKQLVGT